VTAEIAVMNKLAVALATDSAVTLSDGGSQEKIFDSADKLFELSDRDSIGVMIYNTMDFMGIPLAVLVKEYRHRCASYQTVRAAAEAFLAYLQEEGRAAPEMVRQQALELAVEYLVRQLRKTVDKWIMDRIRNGDFPTDAPAEIHAHALEIVRSNRAHLSVMQDAPLLDGPLAGGRLNAEANAVLSELTDRHFPDASDDLRREIRDFLELFVQKEVLSPTRTGIVVAGFGSKEKFPSLIWYETDGVLGGHLKFREAAFIDIDRSGQRAAVLPFAQQDMVERFLYGLDVEIEQDVMAFCGEAIPEIANSLLDEANVADADRARLNAQARTAEKAFLDQLTSSAFDKIRQSARTEIEGMIEFMPKPEMAKMAEALIDLTSIKRRVSRGIETVSGPVDVAVISRAEGFVWVKRKHYFPTELNARYAARVQAKAQARETNNAADG
jgi:hypothetical protein